MFWLHSESETEINQIYRKKKKKLITILNIETTVSYNIL